MKVIICANQKGGVGKTTVAQHLAVQALKTQSKRVAMMDLDPQGSTTDWWNAREAADIDLVKVPSLDALEERVQACRKAGIAFLFIDTPPSKHPRMSEILHHADLVVVPTGASPIDLRAVGPTVDMAEAARRAMVFVLNGVTPRARITGQAAIALSQHGTIAPVMLGSRVDLVESGNDGRTAQEIAPSGASAREVAQLWDYISGRLARPRAAA